MCMIDDCSSPEFYDLRVVKAKKEHKCGECHRIIQKGEQYEYVSGRWEGDFGVFKTCLHCAGAREWLQIQCHGYVHGVVEDDLREHCEYPEYFPIVARLVVGMRRQWERFKGQGLMPIPVIKETKIKRAIN